MGTLDSAPLPNGCCISERRKLGYAGLRDAQPRTRRGPIREAQIEAGGHVSYIGANSVPIVKRLLNQLAYPLGVSARSASPIATERRISLSPRDPPASLDTFPPSPDAELLSAEEAKARLREIVEGFFFRRLTTEDGKAIRRLVVKSPPGLGETTPRGSLNFLGEARGLTGLL